MIVCRVLPGKMDKSKCAAGYGRICSFRRLGFLLEAMRN